MTRAAISRRDGAHAARPDGEPVGDIVEHRHVPEQGVGLEDEADAALLHGERAASSPSKAITPSRSGVEPGDQAQQRGLAGAGRSEQRQKFAGRDVEIDRSRMSCEPKVFDTPRI